MLLKDAKRALRQIAQEEKEARIEVDDEGIVVKVTLARDLENEVALFYMATRGKGNSSVHVWAYVSIWSREWFAEPGFALEPAFLDEVPAKHRQSIIRLRVAGVHEYAFLSPTGAFMTEVVAFRPEEQIIEWTIEHLRDDFAKTVAQGRSQVPSMPSPQALGSLISQRRQARQRLRRGEA